MRIYYQNVRGLRTKTSIFYKNILLNEYDVICITETWLLPAIFDLELFDSRYNVYRCDRNYAVRGDTMGGGVLIAVHRKFNICNFKIVPVLNSVAEIISVSLSLNGTSKDIYNLYSCYFPHCNAQKEVLNIFYEYISYKALECQGEYYIIFGDFNIPCAEWLPVKNVSFSALSGNFNVDYVNDLSNFMSINDFRQFNLIYNSNNRVLDLVIANVDCSVSASEPLVPEDKHHPAFCCEVPIRKQISLIQNSKSVKLFGSANYDDINHALSNIDWDEYFTSNDINHDIKTFYNIIDDIIIKFVPVRVIHNKNKYPIWFNRALIKIINEKLKYHRKWKIYGRVTDYNTFRLLRDRQKVLQEECFNNFISDAESKISRNSKHFWTYVKSKRKNLNDLPDSMFIGDVRSSSGEDICNLFNQYFNSVFESHSQSCHDHIDVNQGNNLINLNHIYIDRAKIESYLKNININKGAGPDGLPPILLKHCCKQLSEPLFRLFNLSLKTGVMPYAWKQSFVTPVFKSGNKQDIENYRPISKLNVIPKLFEKIVYDALYPIIRPVLMTQQHGFMTKKSTESNLCEYLDIVYKAMDAGLQVDAVYTDYSKAFDKISHEILIKKLDQIGVHGDLLRWLTSYLRDRSQAVAVKGYCSSFLPVSSGVPQGSHLGPLLFNIYINDVLLQFQHSNILLFADDKKVFKIIHNQHDCELLQEDINRLYSYCSNNLLFLNIKKCNVITFSRKNKPIEYDYKINNVSICRVTELRDLGVHLDHKLLFKSHIEKIVDKSYRMLGFVLRITKDFKRPSTLIMLYNSLVRSTLEYCSTVWNPQYNIYIESIEKNHKKFLKHFQFRFDGDASILYRLDSDLKSRRTVRDQMLLYKIIHNRIDSIPLLSVINFKCQRISARNKLLFCTSTMRTKYGKNNFVTRACKSYNKIFSHVDVFSLSYGQFKKEIEAVICSSNSQK